MNNIQQEQKKLQELGNNVQQAQAKKQLERGIQPNLITKSNSKLEKPKLSFKEKMKVYSKILFMFLLIVVVIALLIYLAFKPRDPPTKAFRIDFPNETITKDIDDNGKIEYLDRYNIDCKNNVLNKLQGPTSGKGGNHYKYGCSTATGLNPSVLNSTPINEIGNHNIEFLDRHNVDCGSNALITKYKLERNGDNINYSYGCATSNDPLTCRSVSTDWNSRGGGTTEYLFSKHNINCKEDEALSRLQMENQGGDARFNYTCCKKA